MGMRGFQLPFGESPDAGSTPAVRPTDAITGRVSIERTYAQKSMLGQLSAEKGRKGRLGRPLAFFSFDFFFEKCYTSIVPFSWGLRSAL